MKKVFLLVALLSALCVQSLTAQVIKGDMNDDGVFDIGDVSESVNTVIGKRAIQYVQGGGDPYMVDNSLVAGTWYLTKSEHFTLNADGTTDYSSDFGDVATYEFLPYQGCIIFYDKSGKPLSWIEVKKLMPGRMICNFYDKGDELYVLTTVPTQLVTSIQLSAKSLVMSAGEFKQISATVLPEDADNKSVAWESSNEGVAKVVGDIILAIDNGIAVITCRATDGSGVKATCEVKVAKKMVPSGYVDLGLPGGVLWATCNVGADKPEDNGLYFAWGETTGYAKDEKHNFNWSNYKWMTPGENSMQYVNKYQTTDELKEGVWYNNGTFVGDGKITLDPEDDAATANWGSGWRMPTLQEIKDLYDSRYTSTEWVTENGVRGRKITSKSNGNSIFLPAAGYFDGANLLNEGSSGDYLSSSLYTRDSSCAYDLHFYNGSDGSIGWYNYYRYNGQSVRAVRAASE